MKIGIFINAPAFEYLEQLRNILAQEVGIGVAGGGGIPAKKPLVLAIFPTHHLGSRFGAPLGKEVGVLIVPDAIGLTQVNPTVQPVEKKTIAAVRFFKDLYQLNSGRS